MMVMREYGPRGIDWMRVIEMVAVHDLVEIDAGDVSAYDVEALAAKAAREQVAAERIFGLLPTDQQQQFRQLWDEFEALATPEARFANAVDRLQPLIQNAHAAGGSWRGQTLAARADPAPDGADRGVAAGYMAARDRRGRVVLCCRGASAGLAVLGV